MNRLICLFLAVGVLLSRSALANPTDRPGLTILPGPPPTSAASARPSPSPLAPSKVALDPPSGPTAIGNEADELIREHQELANQTADMNAFNPLSDASKSLSDILTLKDSPTIPPQIRAILNVPVVQSMIRLFASPGLTDALQKLVTDPRRVNVLYGELAWMMAIFLLGTWRNSRTKHWGALAWIRISNAVLFWAGSFLLIPWLIMREPYERVIELLYAYFTGH